MNGDGALEGVAKSEKRYAKSERERGARERERWNEGQLNFYYFFFVKYISETEKKSKYVFQV
jgi:hypothetical protein